MHEFFTVFFSSADSWFLQPITVSDLKDVLKSGKKSFCVAERERLSSFLGDLVLFESMVLQHQSNWFDGEEYELKRKDLCSFVVELEYQWLKDSVRKSWVVWRIKILYFNEGWENICLSRGKIITKEIYDTNDGTGKKEKDDEFSGQRQNR